MTKRIADLAPEYAPYNQLPEFEEGLCAFALGIYTNPYNSFLVAAQAWDRGMECAMRVAQSKS
jgi:hypothetical protein